MNLETQLQEDEKAFARTWKLMAFRGAVAIAFAIAILVWPNIGLSVLIGLFAAFAFVSGLTTVVGAFSGPLHGNQRVGLVLQGLLGIAVGVAVFVWPELSALGLLYAIAIWAIAIGLMEIALALALPISGGRALLFALSGMLSIAFGVIMFAHPGAGAVALLALVAALLLVGGVTQIALAVEMRSLVEDIKRPFKRQATTTPLLHG